MRIVVWGTGEDAVELLGLLDMDRISAVGFVDEDPEARAAPFLDQEVLDPEVLPLLQFDLLFIAHRHWRERLHRATRELAVPEDKVKAYHWKRFDLLRRYGRRGVIPSVVPDSLVEELDSKEWYHKVDLFPGVTTPGPAHLQNFLLDQVEAGGYVGKKVLDIGAWTGPYTFEVERRGGEVTAYDIQDPERSGFNLLKKLKGSRATYVRDTVYNLGSHFEEQFDIVLFFGVYYHLKNPMLAFENIYKALKPDGIMLYEGAVLEFAHTMDPVWAARKDRMGPYLEVPMAYYTTGDCFGHFSNWYVPNALCLRQWVISAGFDPGRICVVPGGSRGYGMARKLPEVPLEHSS